MHKLIGTSVSLREFGSVERGMVRRGSVGATASRERRRLGTDGKLLAKRTRAHIFQVAVITQASAVRRLSSRPLRVGLPEGALGEWAQGGVPVLFLIMILLEHSLAF